MTVFQSEADLSEPTKHKVLSEVLHDSSLLSLFMLLLYSALQITSICIVHYNAQFAFLSFVYFPEPDNIGMIEDLQYLSLPQSFLSLVLTHLLYVDLLDDCFVVIRLALHEVGRAEGPRSQGLQFLIGFKLLFLL